MRSRQREGEIRKKIEKDRNRGREENDRDSRKE